MNYSLYFLIFTVLIIIPASTEAFAQSDSEVIILGTLSEVHGISPNNQHISQYYVDQINEDGTITSNRIVFDSTPNNIQNFLGKKIIAQGFESSTQAKTLSESSNYINIHTIKLADNQLKSSTSGDPLPAFGSGTQNIVTLMVKYSDVSNTGHTRSYVQDLIYDAPDSLHQLYQTVSYGNMGLSSPGNVEDWTTLSGSRATYAAGGPSAGLILLAQHAMAAHPSINYNSVDGIIIVVNGCITSSCYAWGDVATRPYTSPSGTINTRISWMPDTTSADGVYFPYWSIDRSSQNGLGVLGHEVGHNQSFLHTTPPFGNWAGGAGYSTYTDMWSIMSANWDGDGPSPFVMNQRNSVGWIPVANKVNIPIGTQSTITLDFANQPLSGSNKKYATIPLPDGTTLTLGAYKDGLFSDTPNNNEGIVMHRFYPGGNQIPELDNSFGDRNNPLVLVATAGTNTSNDLVNANLDVGETWNGPNGVIIRVDSKTATSITASISNGAGPLIGQCGYVENQTWIISSNCTLTESILVNRGITVQNGALLTIPSGMAVVFDPSTFGMTVQSGGGVLIKAGGKLESFTTGANIAIGSGVPGCETTNSCFEPHDKKILVGQTVKWPNIDAAVHTVTSGTPGVGPDGNFNSGLLLTGNSFSHTFNAAGSFDYFCMVHPWMTGVVTVS